MKKRILSILLTLCMVLMLVPVTVFAEEETHTATFYFDHGTLQLGDATVKDSPYALPFTEEDGFNLGSITDCAPYTFLYWKCIDPDTGEDMGNYESGEYVETYSDIAFQAVYQGAPVLAITVGNFEAGKTPKDITYSFASTNLDVTFSEEDIQYVTWEKLVSDGSAPGWVEIGETEAFEAGISYRCRIALDNKGLDTVPTVTVNGRTPEYCTIVTNDGVPVQLQMHCNLGTLTTTTSIYTQDCESIDSLYFYSQHDLGATYSPERTTFKVWAPTATEVQLNLYATGSDSEEGAEDIGTVPLEKLMDGEKWTGVWTTTVEGNLKNQYYTYTIAAAKTTGSYQKPKETQDVYSVATGINGNRSMVCDLDSTDPEGWENDDHIFGDESTDSVVWELHVQDFSYDPASGVSKANRGKYMAFTETGTTLNGEGNVSTCIDYLKELGVTTVQINPFYDFGSINEAGSDSQYNWGYDPQNYNVPEGFYSSNPYDGNVRIKECKSMIQALHDAGISVVMNVDYSHTYSTNSCFQATVPDYYYRMTNTGAFSNGSGYGNECATERVMYREYIIQSLLYWVNEYHVDGFCFDLMGIMDVETMNLAREALDSVDARITTWGEGWAGGASYHPTNTCTGEKFYPATQANAAKLSDRIALFNDAIRDGITGGCMSISNQGFVQGAETSAPDIRYGVSANSSGGNKWLASAPSQCVSYASSHDNATLYDQILGSTGLASYGVRESTAVKMNKLGGAIVYTSQGISFMLAGEEMCRSKDGDTNSFKSHPEVNMIKWQNVVDYADVVSYYKGLSNIRKHFTPLTCADNSYSDAYIFNGNMADASKQIAFTIANDTPGEWSKMAVIYNSDSAPAEITLKDTSVTEWVVIANGVSAGVEKLDEVSGSTFTVPAYTALIAVDKISFDTAGHECIDEDPKDHKCDICRKILSQHTGGTATCISKAVCDTCGEEYDEIDSTNHNLEKIPAKDATVTAAGNKEYWHCKDCGKYFADENGTNEIKLEDTVISKFSPEIIEGKGQSITAGDKKELTFKSNAAFSDFVRAQLDGKTLDEKNYTVKEGSTVVTLKADYVATLSAGEHTIGIVSTNGTATTTFTVNAKAEENANNDTKSPQTGDSSNMALWIALLFVSGAGVIGTTVYGKKKRAK